jgi:Holliday junction resolvasome RuvABC ATP-dependent DNA helicase subunit
MVIASTNQYWRLPETLRSRFGKPLEFYTYNQEQYIKAVIKALKIEEINEDLAKIIAEKTASLGMGC